MTDISHPRASIISLDLAGMKSQAYGLAERCAIEADFSPIIPRKPWHRISSHFWPFPFKAIQPFVHPLSRHIISVGGTGGTIAAALKARDKDKKLIQIQNPRRDLKIFDLIIANHHDEITGPNVLLSRTALHRVSQQKLIDSQVEWQTQFGHFDRPMVAVLLGGTNGRFVFEKKEGERLARQLAEMIKRDNVHVMVTPSRRTSKEALQALVNILTPLGGWIWDMEGPNPYFGLLSHADALIVTMDSVSMISEAVATSAPVFIAELPGQSRRIGLFIKDLLAIDRVRFFTGRFLTWKTERIDDTDEIAEILKEKIAFF